MKILLDMNISPAWKARLDQEGIDAVHWSEIGAPDAPDTQLLSYAGANGYIVFTHDLDFSAILAATQARFPSVFQLRSLDITPESSAAQVVASLREYADFLEKGALLTIDKKKSRVRILPLNNRSGIGE